MEELVSTLSSVAPMDTALLFTSTVAQTTESTNAEAASSANTGGSARLVPKLSTSLPIPEPFPQPFDTTLSLNFTAPCLAFLGSFLSDPTFVSCRPLSFLMPSSAAFASLTRARDLEPLAAVVQASLEPQIKVDMCSSAMEAFGGEMAKKCAADLKTGNALASQALTGFEAYALVHNITGLNNTDGTNCFLDATAASGGEDLYLFSLWQGQALPPSTKPTCSACSKALLSVYASSGLAANSSTALSTVYGRAVNLTNAACGPNWASLVVVQPEQWSAAALGPRLNLLTAVELRLWALGMATVAACML